MARQIRLTGPPPTWPLPCYESCQPPFKLRVLRLYIEIQKTSNLYAAWGHSMCPEKMKKDSNGFPRQLCDIRENSQLATLVTHAIVAATLGQAAKAEWRKEPQFWILVVLCSVLPDLDVIGFRFGLRYGDLWGHRGMTHSLLFAVLLATCVAAAIEKSFQARYKRGLLLFLVAASHGALDAFTDGGLGVAFFSPFDPQRYFFSWQPIHVSPIGVARFFSARGIRVLWSEILWVWIPSLVLGFLLWGLRWYMHKTANGRTSRAASGDTR
jgi:inner membrane protein